MLIPQKIVCDICGQEIGYKGEIFTTKHFGRIKNYYAVNVTTYEFLRKPTEKRIDICESCFSKMSEWVVNETYKEE